MTNHRMLFVALIAGSFSACGNGQDDPSQVESSPSSLVAIQGASCVSLLAGQTIPAGTVCSAIEGENIRVTYATSDGWMLYETHLWAGTSLAAMPQTNSGNPKLGNFPYNASGIGGATSFSFLVPLSTFGLTSEMTSCASVNLYVVAHAVVKKMKADGTYQSETAYGEGSRLVQKGNWATWFSILLTCVDDQPKVRSCETAFAYGSARATCFIDSGIIQTSRWGWFNGPLAPGSYSFAIYAGAGQCDLSKGTLVGSLSVAYNGTTAQVSYAMSAGFTMDETHLYVGNAPLPSKNGSYTVAPGQYGNLHTLSAAASDSYTVSGLSGDIYVVAHAVTCSTAWP